MKREEARIWRNRDGEKQGLEERVRERERKEAVEENGREIY